MIMRRVFLVALVGAFFILPLSALGATSSAVSLAVPQLWEIPDGVWVKPWNGACEESSITMIEQYYLHPGKRIVPKAEGKKLMLPLFPIEDRLFGSNSDTNSTRTAKIINDYTSFDAQIKTNPTLEEIKNELRNGHPVISLHYGYNLKNPRHSFRSGGSSYHTMVITGFDDNKNVFFVNDPELKDGLDFAYSYAIIMASLHDFNHATKLATGAPTVIFTTAKTLVRGEGRKRIYLVRDGVRHNISNPAVFKNHRLSFSLVKIISVEELNSYAEGASINN